MPDTLRSDPILVGFELDGPTMSRA